jgi:hypothetical protein
MNKIVFLFLPLFLIACKEQVAEQTNEKPVAAVVDTVVANPKANDMPVDSSTWMDAFKHFRTAVYEADKAKVKSFINFPIMNEQNEIWYLGYKDGDKEIAQMQESIKPFTEKDFDKCYKKIFPTTFANSILKIKTEELLSKGECETVALLADGLNYKTMATIDKEKNQLVLNMAYYSPKNAIKEGEEGTEYNVIYYFDILPNKQIRFKQIRMAG